MNVAIKYQQSPTVGWKWPDMGMSRLEPGESQEVCFLAPCLQKSLQSPNVVVVVETPTLAQQPVQRFAA